jgi:rRNA small subunit pseudouridine methyltransferase Nep1
MPSKNKRKEQPDDHHQADDLKPVSVDEPFLKGAKKAKLEEKRLIVVLEQANLETIKVGKVYELLNCNRHKNHLLKYK